MIESSLIDIPQWQNCRHLFYIDQEKIIQSASTYPTIPNSNSNGQGQSFLNILSSLNPDWVNYLPKNWFREPRSFFLPIDQSLGMMIDAVMTPNGMCVLLLPSIIDRHESVDNAQTEPSALSLSQLLLRLQIAENRLKNYLKTFPGIFFSQRADGSFNYISPGFDDWLGYEPKNWFKSGTAFLKSIAEEDRRSFLNAMLGQDKNADVLNLKYRLEKSDKSMLHLLDIRRPQFSNSGFFLGHDGVWLDITRQSIAEKHLNQSAWKHSLSILTGGLLHDFSNTMACIYAICELYESQLEVNHEWKSGLTQIRKSVQDAQGLVRRVMDLHREKVNRKQYIDLKAFLREQKDLLSIILSKNTQIEYELADAELPVYLDDVLLRQTMMNFAMNARDAFGGKPGRIKIQLSAIEKNQPLGPEFKPEMQAFQPGAVIRFIDYAGGIHPNHVSKIFDPFFTTKQATQGSGLGLYNAKLFVEASGGHLGVCSEWGIGCSFGIYLPCCHLDDMDTGS